MKMDDKFKFSKFGKMSFQSSVGPEPMGEVISSSYNTIWSCVFTLDPIKEVKNEIWLIQDKEAPRRSIQYLMQLKDRFLKRPSVLQSIFDQDWLKSTLLKSTDLVGSLGGILFLFSALSQAVIRLTDTMSTKKSTRDNQRNQRDDRQVQMK